MVSEPRSDAAEVEREDNSDVLLRKLSSLGTHSAEGFQAASSFNDLLRSATRHLARLVEADRVRIWVARRGGKRLETREFTPGERAPAVTRVAAGEGMAGWCIERGETLRLAPGDPRPAFRGDVPAFRSAMVVPLFRRGDAFGAVECFDHRDGAAFSAADFDHLEMAAEHVAFALDNALLYEETERRSLEKEVLLEISRALSAPYDL